MPLHDPLGQGRRKPYYIPAAMWSLTAGSLTLAMEPASTAMGLANPYMPFKPCTAASSSAASAWKSLWVTSPRPRLSQLSHPPLQATLRAVEAVSGGQVQSNYKSIFELLR